MLACRGRGRGGYWDYPTGSDDEPDKNLPSADSGNSANYMSSSLLLADIDAYGLSASPYGTVNQGGNVSEWYEFAQQDHPRLPRGARGGNWRKSSGSMLAYNLGHEEANA